MTRMGMDPEVISGIGRQLQNHSARLGGIMNSIDHLQRQAGGCWEGHDLDVFQQQWATSLRSQVQMAVHALNDMGGSALRNAQEQVQASGGTGTFRDNLWFQGTPRSGSLGHVRDLVDIAEATYDHSIPPAGWVKVGPDGLKELGFDSGDFSDSSGFHAELFITEEGKYVLAFRGTDTRPGLIPNTVEVDEADLATDAMGAVGTTAQDRQAIALALETKARLGEAGSTLEFTGHSLGGRHAALASIATGNPATTFNAAGVSSHAIAMASQAGHGSVGVVLNYATSGDWLTLGQAATAAPDAYGTTVFLPTGVDGDQHGLGKVREGLAGLGVR